MNTTSDLNDWLISQGRLLGDGAAVVEGYASRLVKAGVPLSRANIAQRFANPLLIAWGVIWTPQSTNAYDVTHANLYTDAYVGGPFEYVQKHRKPLHKSLVGLDRETEHSVYLELADAGGTDLFAILLTYGDGSRHGCTFVSDDPQGFSDAHLELINRSADGLACAMEPITMRKSTESLLRTYLGNGPASAVIDGTIRRGEKTSLEAVIMFTDLRGFTAKSESWNEADLLAALNGYFDAVVQSVEEFGGDILKFMGDGILSIFPIDRARPHADQCRNAHLAARASLARLAKHNDGASNPDGEALSIGVGINVGPVTYGNIGSPNRLDFTVLGPAVNIASRVQDLCKVLGEPVLVTQPVAAQLPGDVVQMGSHAVRGVARPLEIFAPRG